MKPAGYRDVGRGGLRGLRDAPLRQRQPGDRGRRGARRRSSRRSSRSCRARSRQVTPNPLAPPAAGPRHAGREHPELRVRQRRAATSPAPRCLNQGPYTRARGQRITTSGETTQYPHVRRGGVEHPRADRVAACLSGSAASSRFAAARVPRPVVLVARRARARRRAARAAPGAEHAADTLVGKAARTATRRPQRYTSASATTPSTSSSRGDLTKLVLTADLGRLLGLEGCVSGNVPAGARRAAARDGPCGRLARDQAGQGRVRPGDVHQRVGPPAARRSSSSRTATRAARADARREGGRAARAQARAQPAPRPSSSARRRASSSTPSSRATSCSSRCATACAAEPRLDDPDFVSTARLRRRRSRRARRRRASPTCSRTSSRRSIQVRLQAGAVARTSASDAIDADPRARWRCRDWRLENGGTLRRHRRAGRRQRPRRRGQRLDPAAARRRAARHGGDARARLPRARCACCRSSSRSRRRR